MVTKKIPLLGMTLLSIEWLRQTKRPWNRCEPQNSLYISLNTATQKQSHLVKWKCLVAILTTLLLEEAFRKEKTTGIIPVTADEIVGGATAVEVVGTMTAVVTAGVLVTTEVIVMTEATEVIGILLPEGMTTDGSEIEAAEDHDMVVQECQARMICTKKSAVGSAILWQLALGVSIQEDRQLQKKVYRSITIASQKGSMPPQLIERRPGMRNNGASRKVRLLLQGKEAQKRFKQFKQRSES
mmetsp:Transcript_7615/g.18335  ORF Transcript_7615/g.18335 Transcript_7615/m.18335 type:complete len:241 (+) Transcript_7615:886-1608(+)